MNFGSLKWMPRATRHGARWRNSCFDFVLQLTNNFYNSGQHPGVSISIFLHQQARTLRRHNIRFYLNQIMLVRQLVALLRGSRIIATSLWPAGDALPIVSHKATLHLLFSSLLLRLFLNLVDHHRDPPNLNQNLTGIPTRHQH